MAIPPPPAGFVIQTPLDPEKEKEKGKIPPPPAGFVMQEAPAVEEEKGLLSRSLERLRGGTTDAIAAVMGDTYGKYGEDDLTPTPMVPAGRLLQAVGGDIPEAIGDVAGDTISTITPDWIKSGLTKALTAMQENRAEHPIYSNANPIKPVTDVIDSLPPGIGESIKQGANIAALQLPKTAKFSRNADSNFKKFMDDRDAADTQKVLEPYNIKKPDVRGDVVERGRTNYQEYEPTYIEQRQYERTAKVPGWEPRRSARYNINAIEAEVDKMAEQLNKDLFSVGKHDIKSSRTNSYEVDSSRAGRFEAGEPKRIPHKNDGITLEDDINKAIQEITENPMLQGDAAKTAQGVYEEYQKILKKYESGNEITPQALLASRKELDSIITKQSASDVFDPKTENAKTIALAKIRQVINHRINEAVPNAKVSESLSQQADLLTSRDHLYQRDMGEARGGLSRAMETVEDTAQLGTPKSPMAITRNIADTASMVLAGTVTAAVLFGRGAVKQGKRLKGATQKAVDAAINAGDSPALLAILNNEENYEEE